MSKLASACVLGLALLGAIAPATAQETSRSLQSCVGDCWLYDNTGQLIGSVYALTDGGRTVVLQLGSYLTPGRRLVPVPAANVAIVDGRATLRALTAEHVERLPGVG